MLSSRPVSRGGPWTTVDQDLLLPGNIFLVPAQMTHWHNMGQNNIIHSACALHSCACAWIGGPVVMLDFINQQQIKLITIIKLLIYRSIIIFQKPVGNYMLFVFFKICFNLLCPENSWKILSQHCIHTF